MARQWDPSLSAAKNARVRLPALAKEYFETGRALMQADSSAAVLHKFRLATKRFRYTLEVFVPCYGPRLEQCLAELRKIQTWLGDANDDATTRTLLTGRMSRTAWSKFDRFLAARTTESVSSFRTYWKEVFDKPGEEDRWVRYLATAPRPKH